VQGLTPCWAANLNVSNVPAQEAAALSRSFSKNIREASQPDRICHALQAPGLCAAMPGLAQTVPAAPSDEGATQRVVITANQRAERQQDLAGAVSQQAAMGVERRSARALEDGLELTSGVQFNEGDIAGNPVTIRGIGIGIGTAKEGSGARQGPSGPYPEDVPLSSPSGKGTVLSTSTRDPDRVEVLRGPLGVLSGADSLGAAVRCTFNKPRLAYALAGTPAPAPDCTHRL
jgi:iron complex outermembrane receptor protein